MKVPGSVDTTMQTTGPFFWLAHLSRRNRDEKYGGQPELPYRGWIRKQVVEEDKALELVEVWEKARGITRMIDRCTQEVA